MWVATHFTLLIGPHIHLLLYICVVICGVTLTETPVMFLKLTEAEYERNPAHQSIHCCYSQQFSG